MKRSYLWLWLAVLGVGRPASGAPLTRALIISANLGSAQDAPLKFAQSDGRRLAQLLVELDASPRSAVTHLSGATVDQARAEISLVLSQPGRVLLFLTSHGGDDGLHLSGGVLPWAALRHLIERGRADVVVALVDACQSGALLTPKGFTRGRPVKLALERPGPKGRVLITSSGASEISNESVRLQASPFAHHLMTGLRGGADENRDGRVTVFELYAHLYGRTVAATIAAPSGAQHPERNVKLSGAGEIALVEGLNQRGARVYRSPGARDVCYVLDKDEIQVRAELSPAQAFGPRLSLAPGVYVVKCVSKRWIRYAKTRLAGSVDIDALEFEIRPLGYSIAKGQRAIRRARLSIAGALLVESAGVMPGALMRMWGGSQTFGWSLQTMITSDARRALLLAGGGYALPWLPDARLRLELGLGAGAALSGQRGMGGVGNAVLFNQYVYLSFSPKPWMSIDGRVDFATAFSISEGRTSFLAVFTLGLSYDFLP